MAKNIILKVCFLVVLFITMNFIYTRWYFEEDIQKHSEIIGLVHDIPVDADIIYIGESSNNTFHKDDVDKRPISAFIGDYYKDLNTYDITKPASHAGIFKVLLSKIPENNQVKTVVVTLNLRSFNATWIYSNLETSLQKSLVLLKPYPPFINRILLSFKGYDVKSTKEREVQFKRKWRNDQFHLPFEFPFDNVIEWDESMAVSGIQDHNGNIDQHKTILACHYIKTYGFQLDTLKNIRIHDFNDIIELARERNWNLVFNLLAENTEKAGKLVGKDLVYMMNENAKLLENYFQKRGVIVVNNLNLVEDEQFIDQDWTTEHYAEKGRKAIARNVANALKKWHSAYYIDSTSYDEQSEQSTH